MAIAFSLMAVFLVLFVTFVAGPKPRSTGSLPKPANDVRRLASAGRKVEAIQAYRKQTGASLLEAKQVIEHYAV